MGAPAHRRRDRGGFALLEVMLALMLMALLATLALPGLVRTTGPAALRVAAFETEGLLREDRTAARRSGQPSAAGVVDGRMIRSLTTARVVALPPGAEAAMRDTPAIRFFADGRSSGGAIVIASAAARYVVSVSPDTGAIHVAAP